MADTSKPVAPTSRRTLLLASAAALAALAGCGSAPKRTSDRSGEPRASGSSRMPKEALDGPTRSRGLEEMSIQAIGLIGTPYRWGGNTPEGGFDCSGLVSYIARRAVGIQLPRNTQGIGRFGEPVPFDEIANGDLVFFNTTGHPHSHVGIYVGQRRFVHAPSSGGTVRLEDMTQNYWANRFTEVRRLV